MKAHVKAEPTNADFPVKEKDENGNVVEKIIPGWKVRVSLVEAPTVRFTIAFYGEQATNYVADGYKVGDEIDFIFKKTPNGTLI